jgi:hypothetical protein
MSQKIVPELWRCFVIGDSPSIYFTALSLGRFTVIGIHWFIMSRHQNSGQNQNIRTANESFEKVAKFIYLGMTLTNQNDIHDEIKSRLNSGNA